VWLLGEDAVLAAAVFGTNGLDQASFKRFKSAVVSNGKPVASVLWNTQSGGTYQQEQNEWVTDQGATQVTRPPKACQGLSTDYTDSNNQSV